LRLAHVGVVKASILDHLEVEGVCLGRSRVLAGVERVLAAALADARLQPPALSLRQEAGQGGTAARPVAERLAEIGALEALRGTLTRRDLLLQIAEVHRQTHGRQDDGQLPLDDGTPVTAEPSGLPEMTKREALGAELSVLGIDVSQHLMEHHHQLLREIGATDAAHLPGLRPGQPVLVAGVRASTQTPPIASGKRIIFVTLEDGSGLVDLGVFRGLPCRLRLYGLPLRAAAGTRHSPAPWPPQYRGRHDGLGCFCLVAVSL
jgi:error-prone DNA polymerase